MIEKKRWLVSLAVIAVVVSSAAIIYSKHVGPVNTSRSLSVTAISDGFGGFIVSFGTRAQKIDTAGNMVWPVNGVLFATGGANSIAYDGHGGAVIAWGESRFAPLRFQQDRTRAETRRRREGQERCERHERVG